MSFLDDLIKKSISLYRNSEIENMMVQDNSKANEERYIVFITFKDNEKVVLKIYENYYTTISQIESWSRLANVFNDNDIVTPLFIKSINNNHGELLEFNNKKYFIWMEQWIYGKYWNNNSFSLQKQDNAFFYEIGKLNGRMHRLSKQYNLLGQSNASTILFKPFSSADKYDENFKNANWLYSTLKSTNVDQKLLDNLWEVYNRKRNELKSLYHTLPNGLIQGDLSPCNYIINDNDKLVGIYDYKLAGNDTYVSAFIQNGIILCYESYNNEYLSDSSSKYMNARFNNYIKGYTSQYTLNEDEIKVLSTLYNISRPFTFNKIKKTIDKFNEGKIDEVNSRLQWMYVELTKTSNIPKSLTIDNPESSGFAMNVVLSLALSLLVLLIAFFLMFIFGDLIEFNILFVIVFVQILCTLTIVDAIKKKK